MELLLLLIAQTVPYEYPYLEVVRREVWFIPMPKGADSTTYNESCISTLKKTPS